MAVTGAGKQRGRRSSGLLFHWESRLCSLVANTGHVLVPTPTISGGDQTGYVTGRNGLQSRPGFGMARFDQAAAQGTVTRLLVEYGLSGLCDEQYRTGWVPRVMACSIYAKLYPVDAPGTNLGLSSWAVQLGEGASGGGLMAIGKSDNAWWLTRSRSGVSISAAFTEPAGLVYPVEVMGTLSLLGQIALFTRDAAGVLRNGTSTPTNATMMIPTDLWGNSVLILGAGAGGRWRYESIKIPRGVYATVDSLARAS